MKNGMIDIRQVHVDDGFWNKLINNAVEHVLPYQWRHPAMRSAILR
jgi:uncharacterized protein